MVSEIFKQDLESKISLQVDDSGKVQRMRKSCPSESCGPGIFMATHFNRVYWQAFTNQNASAVSNDNFTNH